MVGSAVKNSRACTDWACALRRGVPGWLPHSMPAPASDQHAPLEVFDLSVVLVQPVRDQRLSSVSRRRFTVSNGMRRQSTYL